MSGPELHYWNTGAKITRRRRNCGKNLFQRHPKDAEAINELGTVLVCAGEFEEGLDCFRRALGIALTCNIGQN